MRRKAGDAFGSTSTSHSTRHGTRPREDNCLACPDRTDPSASRKGHFVLIMHIGPLDASLFRLLLCAKAHDTANLPACLRATDRDRTRVEASLSKVVGPLRLPQASNWLARLDTRRGAPVCQDGTAGTE